MAIHRISRIALESPDVGHMLDRLVREVMELYSAQGCAILRWDDARGELALAAACGVAAQPAVQELPGPDAGNQSPTLNIPLSVAGRTLGALELTFASPELRVSAGHDDRWGEIAALISLAMDKAILLEQERLGRDQAQKNADHQASVAAENARLLDQVRLGRERLYDLSLKLVEVQEGERRMIAQELHDQIGQELTALILTLDISKSLRGDDQLSMLAEAQDLANHMMDEVRELSLRLRPSALDDLGLRPALNGFFRRFTRQTGIEVEFNNSGLERRFDPGIETVAFRVIQEALTNISRYAQVRQAYVEVHYQDGLLDMQIKDYGKGFCLEILTDREMAFGINGMRERVTLVGGRFDIHSNEGVGTTIQALLPVERSVERRRYER